MHVRVVLVVNPGARRVTEDTIAASHRRWSTRHEVTVVRSARAHDRVALDATHLVADAVVVLGGDGIVNTVANALVAARSDAALVPLPAGTTNVVARSLGLPGDLERAEQRAMAALEAGCTARRGVGHLNGVVFVANAGIGWDAAVVARVEARPERKRRWGHAWFAGAALQELRRGRSRSVRLCRSDQPAEDGDPAVDPGTGPEAFWILAVATHPYTYVGSRPIEILGKGTPTDAGVTVVTFAPMRADRLLWLTARATLTSRGVTATKGVDTTLVGGTIVFTSANAAISQTDGEIQPPATEFRIGWHNDALRTLIRMDERRRAFG